MTTTPPPKLEFFQAPDRNRWWILVIALLGVALTLALRQHVVRHLGFYLLLTVGYFWSQRRPVLVINDAGIRMPSKPPGERSFAANDVAAASVDR